MKSDLKERVMQFEMLQLPGQPMGMHMGTAHLVGDLVSEIEKLQAQLEEERCVTAKLAVDLGVARAAGSEVGTEKIRTALVGWAHSARFAVNPSDHPLDLIREMSSQHCDERSMADLVASGGTDAEVG